MLQDTEKNTSLRETSVGDFFVCSFAVIALFNKELRDARLAAHAARTPKSSLVSTAIQT